MNKRISDLVLKAQTQAAKETIQNSFSYEGKVFEKFAELIVKRIIDNVECHASLFNTKEARQVCSWIVKSVEYDFGVSK